MPPRLPLTIADWLAAAKHPDTDLCALLEQCRLSAQRHASDPAWISQPDEETWRAQMRRLQQLLDRSPDRAALLARYPLLGVPFAVKDNIDIAGTPTTAACPAFAYTPARSATAVLKLIDAGAVWLGKTNLDQFATGLVGTRSPYGRPASTYDASRISGGSSSGSAVVVARGWAAFALGTDTAGSGRVPAGFNNLVGLKPTPGRVSTAGVVPACRTLDCVSVFALTVRDAAQVLSVIEGPDPDDAYSRFAPGPDRWGRPPRVGVPMATPFAGSDTGYEAAWTAALAQLEASGARLVPIDFAPLHAVADLLYAGPWVAERAIAPQRLLEAQPQALDPTVARVIGAAGKYSAADAFAARYRLAAWKRELATLWQDLDALMVPTTVNHPRFEEVDADPIGVNSALGTYTNFVNLLGWCALALPAGTTASGLPFGITLIGPAGADAALAQFGIAWTAEPARLLGATGEAARQHPDAACQRLPAAAPTLPIAVVGAHLSGLPLNGQLTERGARLREATTTAPSYRLYALPETTPPKPGLVRVADGGAPIEVEVWDMPADQVGSLLGLIPPPLGLGTIELADGRLVKGFLCEAHAVRAARDISEYGGWRRYLAAPA